MAKATLFPNLVEYQVTSMARYAQELLRALQSIQDPDWQFDSIQCHHVELAAKIVPGAAGRQLANRLGRAVKYPFIAGRTKSDVFHVLDHSHANLTRSLPPERTVITCHDLIPLLAMRGEIDMPVEKMWPRTFPYRVRCIERCAVVLAISESTKRDLIRLTNLTPDRVEVVYFGLNPTFVPLFSDDDTREERRALLHEHHIPATDKVILHVSTGGPYKNTKAILHALRALNRDRIEGGKVWLIRVGSAMNDEEQQLARTLGITDAIINAGRVNPDSRLAKYYRAADVFAFPSLWEGFGWPPLEAMACGTPVVTSNVASLPEVVSDGGLTVDPNDHTMLAKHLQSVMDNRSLRASLSRKALRHSRQFTWETAGRRTLDIYKSLQNRAQQALIRR